VKIPLEHRKSLVRFIGSQSTASRKLPLRARNVGCDGYNGDAIAMAMKESINQVQIAGATTTGPHREFTCQLSLRAGGKSRDFFMSDGNPLDLVADAQRLGDAIERIAHQSVNALNIRSF
jgi:hypothetical protein